jgi:uncharacterized protein
LTGLQERLEQSTRQLSELEELLQRRELDRNEENDRVKKYEARLKDIKNNREYQALVREIGFAKKAGSELEEEIARLKESLGVRKEEVDTAAALVEEKKAALAAKKAEADKVVAELEQSKSVEIKRRDEVHGEIPPDIMSRYKLVRRRTNLVVVNVRAGACQGCFMSLPPQLYNQVKRVDALYTCPNCHRILYYEPQDEAVKV